MKKYISIILSVIIALMAVQVTVFAYDVADQLVDQRTFLIGTPEIEITEIPIEDDGSDVLGVDRQATLPTSVDLTSEFPAPGNQGSQNSCTAWAVGYALQAQAEKTKRNWTVNQTNHKFSPSYIYNQINNGQNQETSIVSALNILKTKGCCPLTYFSYDQSDYTTQPSAIQNSAAALYKISSCHLIGGISTMKNYLNQGYGVVISVKTYSDFGAISSTNPVYDTIGSGGNYGRHAICIVGYNDSMGSSGAFKFINSWGTNWGIGGYGWIAYDLLPQVTNISFLGLPYTGGFIIKKSTSDNYIMGDIDGDSSITSADARLALRYSVGSETPSASQYVLADVNGDGTIGSDDSREILRVATGLQSTFSLYD